jgi:hypothetical protein
MSAHCGHGHDHGSGIDPISSPDLALWVAFRDKLLKPENFFPTPFERHLTNLNTSLSISPNEWDVQRGHAKELSITLFARFKMDSETGLFNKTNNDRGHLGFVGRIEAKEEPSGQVKVSVHPLRVDTSDQVMRELQQLDLFRTFGREMTELKAPAIYKFGSKHDAMGFVVDWLAEQTPELEGTIRKAYRDAQAKVERDKLIEQTFSAPGKILSFLGSQWEKAFSGVGARQGAHAHEHPHHHDCGHDHHGHVGRHHGHHHHGSAPSLKAAE